MQTAGYAVGRYYRPELDVVRFLAFLLVFLHHTLPEHGDARVGQLLRGLAPVLYASQEACGFGLSLFFTLSAFLICELLLRERESAGDVGVKQFYLRRILRIWPLYYLGLFLGVVIALLFGGQQGDWAKFGWFAIFMGAWSSAIQGWIRNPVAPLWSISVEEQFYLFAPWIVKFFNRKALYALCAALVLVANGWLYYLGRALASDNRVWADSFVQFECFAAGILLCLVLRGRVPRIGAWQRLALVAFSLSCWFFATYGFHAKDFGAGGHNPGSWPLIGGYALAALGSVLLLVAFLGVNPKLLPGWAIYLGRISFGLYVYHEFALYISRHLLASFNGHFLRSSVALGLTILMATVSYRYFETPFLKMKKRHSVIESQPIAGA